MATKHRTHEITFCARVKSWAEALFKSRTDLPFAKVDIEESRDIGRKRSDLRFYRSKGDRNPIVAGEVKMPGTAEGRNPYDYKLVEDAHLKATNAGARFFFTWNVNKLVLFDQKLWEKPLIERRVNEFDLGLDLHSPEDVERAEVEPIIIAFVEKLHFAISLPEQKKTKRQIAIAPLSRHNASFGTKACAQDAFSNCKGSGGRAKR